MVLQSQYQNRRHYAKKAVGKKTRMDVRTTEVLDERPHDSFRWLIPALYLTYGYQFLIGLYFTYTAMFQTFTSRSEVIQVEKNVPLPNARAQTNKQNKK